jgi:uncharacterized protein (DUF433 family)
MVDRIETDPHRCGGTPVIKGTSIPVAMILTLDQFAAGESWESLQAGYPGLTREDIQAAIFREKIHSCGWGIKDEA